MPGEQASYGVHDGKAEILPSPGDAPGADVITLPQLERLPEVDAPPAGGTALPGLDTRSARIEALELVRAAVELADRIERDAQNVVRQHLARAEEDMRARRVALDEREVELERSWRELETARREVEQARQEVERDRRQAAEAGEQLRAAQARAEEEAAETRALAEAQATAVLERTNAETDAIADAARREASELVAAAHREADDLVRRARERAVVAGAPSGERGTSGESAWPADGTPAPADVVVSEIRFPPEASLADDEPAAAQPREETESQDEVPFTPPPLTLEDLAAVTSLPRFEALNPFRKR